ncbi:MAG: DUF502 domain-containing protein [Candidatus Omnitrophota bacterium]
MKKAMKRIRNDFLTGLAIILPITITFFIFDFIVKSLNRKLLEPIVKTINPYMTGPYVTLLAKIIIFIFILFIIVIIGAAARVLIVRRFFSFWERLFLKIPMISNIYKAFKQISSAFIGEGRAMFKGVALVEYPRKGMYSIAFVTASKGKKEMVDKAGKELVNLFVPTAPNPTSGIFIAVSKAELELLDMSIEDAFKLIVSAGAV